MEETSRALDAFSTYYEMGVNRSLPTLHDLYNERAAKAPKKGKRSKVPALTTLKLWSTTFHWQQRILELDKERISEETVAKKLKKLKAAEETDEEQASIARGLWIKTAKLLTKRLENEDISNNALVLLIKESWAVHRLSVGSSTARIESELSTNPDKPLIIKADFGAGDTVGEELDRPPS